MGRAEEAEEQIHRLMEEVRLSKASFGDYQAYLLEVLSAITRTARDIELDWPAAADDPRLSLEAILQSRDLRETEAMLSALCRCLTGRIRDTRLENGHRLARTALEYLKAHFAESDVSLEKVCGHLHISTAYFSTLFKRETKKTFHQYLTELRMDKAMTLLTGSDLKTAEIALMVGMGEPSYFSYSFKKYFGVSPSQTRKNMKEAGK